MKYEIYTKREQTKKYKTIKFDGSKECIDYIFKMCKNNECIQNINSNAVIIANEKV